MQEWFEGLIGLSLADAKEIIDKKNTASHICCLPSKVVQQITEDRVISVRFQNQKLYVIAATFPIHEYC